MSTQSVSEPSTSARLAHSLDIIVTVSAIVFWIGIVFAYAATQSISPVQYGVIFLAGILTVYALNESRKAIEAGDQIDIAVLLASSIVLITATVYFALNFEDVYITRQGYAFDHEYFLAQLVLVSILYLTWREFGNLFLALIIGVILYGLYGYVVPGTLNHAGLNLQHILQVLVTDLSGFYGSLNQLAAREIAPFLLYAGLLFGYGAFQLILRVAIQSAKFIESGVAQTAVLSSALMGSINGSYAANAAMTGSFTIPVMKNSGMASHRAAAVESVASTSGQVLPPVMGASAFVMASYLGVAYVDIITAGIIPAVILVGCIAIAVHYVTISDAEQYSMEFSEFFDRPLTQTAKIAEAIRFGVPFAVLIYLLGIVQWTVMSSALWTVVAMIVFGVLIPPIQRAVEGEGRSPRSEFVQQLKNTVKGFRRGALILAPIAIIIAAVNGMVDVFNTTGIPNKIALILIDISGGSLLLAVLLAAGICIVMGIGMPTVAAYVVVAVLVAPTLIQDFGIVEIASHFTVFYSAVLAGITPPVALSAVVASGIAGANFWRTCAVAIKIAAPLFVLPIAFAFNPDLVTFSLGVPTLTVGTLTFLGGVSMIYGLNYPFKVNIGLRSLLRAGLTLLGLVVMVHPSLMIKIAGATVFLTVFAAEKAVVSGWNAPSSEVSR